MVRENPTSTQRRRLIHANAKRCCVCKRRGVGLHLHHIDGIHSHTTDDNLAVLCVEDHDRNHLGQNYTQRIRHTDLDPIEITRMKSSWEAFVAEARNDSSSVVAVVSAYGITNEIHSAQVVFQWQDERIEYVRSFHLLDRNMEQITDEIIEEVVSIGQNIRLMFVNEPLPIDHCPCCGTGFSRTVDPALVQRHTNPKWDSNSICSIYINPSTPSLAMSIGIDEEYLFSGSLHLCKGTHLHFSCDFFEERRPLRPGVSVRDQARRIIHSVVTEWHPGRVLIGTGDHDSPELIEVFDLPDIWEKVAKSSKGDLKTSSGVFSPEDSFGEV